jgi:hypothetical protein
MAARAAAAEVTANFVRGGDRIKNAKAHKVVSEQSSHRPGLVYRNDERSINSSPSGWTCRCSPAGAEH